MNSISFNNTHYKKNKDFAKKDYRILEKNIINLNQEKKYLSSQLPPQSSSPPNNDLMKYFNVILINNKLDLNQDMYKNYNNKVN